MKKHSSTSQFLTVRERSALSTVVPPTFDSARFVRKRKLTDKFEPANLTTNVIVREPLGVPNALNIGTPLTHKNKSSEVNIKRAKENIPLTNKKTSLSTAGLDRKPSLRNEPDGRDRNPRLSKIPLKKEQQNRGYTSSRVA